jgi:Gluconate 2-dehydrogenase subunit 3
MPTQETDVMDGKDETRPVQVLSRAGGVGRRELLQTLAAGASAGLTLPALVEGHPLHTALQQPSKVGTADRKARATSYVPEFLDKHLHATLVALAEQIVPGSTKAKVADFIDALLAVESSQTQRRFLNALGAFEGLARSEHRKTWKALTSQEQVAVLTKASTAEPGAPGGSGASGGGRPGGGPGDGPGGGPQTIRDHFEHLKGWISGAYYSSEIGMRELGWNGNVFFDKLPECGPTGSAE